MSDTPTIRHTSRVTLVTAPPAAPRDSQPTPPFDWQALVARSQPGDANARQRAQASRLRATTDGLTTWANQFGLLTAFVRPSAMFAVVCTSPDAPDDLTRSVARLILWYYTFDSTLDSQPLERIGDTAWVDATINASILPVLADLRLSVARRLVWLADAVLNDTTTPPMSGRLSAALADWLATTFGAWEPLAPDLLVQAFWRQTVAEQLVDAATAMRQELMWTSAWRAGHMVAPTPDAYLRIASRTVGAHLMFAVACRGLGCAPALWAQRRTLLNAAARVIRLANDASSAEADLADHNITAVTSAFVRPAAGRVQRAPTPPGATATTEARGVGDAPGVAEQPERAFQRAQAQVARRLDAAIRTFAHHLATQPSGADADYLRYTVAWALAHYAQGSRG